MKNEPLKCICCNKEQEVLVSVEIRDFSIFLHRKGVCQNCLKEEDINNVCKEYEIRKTKEGIKESEDGLKTLKEHLDGLLQRGEQK